MYELSGISTASLAKIGRGENLTTDVLLKICEALNCNINEIIETVSDETAVQEEPASEQQETVRRNN